MYDSSDPRSSLAAAPTPSPPATDDYASVDHVKFYEIPSFEKSSDREVRYARGQNFTLASIEVNGTHNFEHPDQPDEHMLIIPEMELRASVTALGETKPPAHARISGRPGHPLVHVGRAGREGQARAHLPILELHGQLLLSR